MSQSDSSNLPLPMIGQRKRPLPQPCANPLFLRWMLLLLDEAQSKKRQTRWNFAKAVKALRRYPLVMKQPSECILLEGFGKGTCELLTKKLQDFASERGFNALEEALRIGNSEASVEMLTERQKRRQMTAKINFTGTATVLTQNNMSENAACDYNSLYVPHYRSASYALLMALLTHRSAVGTDGPPLTKTALITQAQPFADTSLLVPDSPGSFYSGWSSMSTLIKRGLVIRKNFSKNGAHFFLTDAGVKLASDLKPTPSIHPNVPIEAVASNSVHSDNSNRIVCGEEKKRNVVDYVAVDEEMPLPLLERLNGSSFCLPGSAINNSNCTSTASRITANYGDNNSLLFWYINDKGERVGRKNDAQVSIADAEALASGSIGFLVECSYESLLTSGIDYRLDYTTFGTLADGQVRAFLDDTETPEICSAFENAGPKMNGEVCLMRAYDEGTSACLKNFSKSRHDGADRKASETEATPLPTQLTSPFTQSSATKELYRLAPGSFEVVLCLDNREHFGMGVVRQQLLPSLLRNGVKCDVRPLNIGDFVWVARQITDENGTKCCREVVLDCIVERKRIDDLASSIKDGRFREQKWRLNRCGLRQIVLLVEDICGGGSNGSRWLGLPVDTLEQAIVNAAVHDGCIIKRCKSARDTVTYLSMLTGVLLQNYKKLEIVAVDRAVKSTNVRQSGVIWSSTSSDEKSVRLIDFTHFQRASAKSQKLCAREHAAKQLLQIRGCTASRAAAILARYPTVQRLYRASIAPGASPLFLSELTYGFGGSNKIGPSLSRAVFTVYSTRKDPFATAVTADDDNGNIEGTELLDPLDELY